MRIPMLRPLILFVLAGVLLLAAIDFGSILLTRMAIPDAAKQVGYAAAVAVENRPATQENAIVALRAARDDAENRDLVITNKGFTLFPDGRVRLTARRTAPTLLLKRLSEFSDMADVSVTVTVDALPFS
jgi:hypothetical protein